MSPFELGNERNRGLSAQGNLDAESIVHILGSENITCFVSSPYSRAIDTIRPLANALNKEITMYEELRERAISSVDIEISENELLAGIKTSFEDLDFKLDGGESTREAQKRAIPIIKQLLDRHRGEHIVLGYL